MRFYFDTVNTKKQDAYLTANAMIGWEWEGFQIYAWGKNLFDENYVTRAFEWGGDWVGRAGDPATFGITIQYRF
ncbi:MAG: hypothetical protein CSA26_12780 [Desulfobacterales bacterium]|nr:MAG: hypothetical protein CSA26_12780 [Desulfobacterales bacterium]